MRVAQLIDVGSTWTKGVAVSLEDGALVARTQHPTTLADGIMRGAAAVMAGLERLAPGGTPAYRAATSSAAGGLRVAALGLVPDLTGLAARQASLGAGARVVFTGSYVLGSDELDAMCAATPDIVLLSGGTDGGNSAVILENARRLAAARLPLAIVLAGNKSVRAEVRALLEAAGYPVRVADNVLPTLETMRVESAQAAIRELFLERIVHARGIEALREWAGGELLPTPLAVLRATEFLADGPLRLGTLVVVDIGGATTDVHSVGGHEPRAGVLLRGLAEPRVKRTVEGDLGLRVSAAAAADALGEAALARALGLGVDALRREVAARVARPETVQERDAFDEAVGVAAIAEALRRHCGWLEALPLRRDAWVQVGKDLRDAALVVGSGGVLAARPDARAMLEAAVRSASAGGERLVPEAAALAIDRDYVMFSVGLLANAHPQAAAALARRSLGLAA